MVVAGVTTLEKEKFNPERLSAAMKAQNISDADLANQIGVSRQMIFLLRKGKRANTSAETISNLAKALGVTIGYLMGGGEAGEQPPVIPKAVRDLARVATRLSDIRQEELLKIAESLEELERAKPVYPVPVDVMRVLLKIAEDVGAGDVLAELEAMLGQEPPLRLIDLSPSDSPNDGE